jgi:glycosyltransferase involved in cell wall biosynthesis
LSILIPLYNEEEFISELLTRVLEAPLPEGMERELIVVDDASNDGSLEIAEHFSQRYMQENINRAAAVSPLSLEGTRFGQGLRDIRKRSRYNNGKMSGPDL